MKKRWGWYLTLLSAKHYKVKLLYFDAGGAISMQRHKHRGELWLWVFGQGWMEANKGVKCKILKKQGDFFPVNKNEWHQFKADKPTLVLEIQYGEKCRERDIERAV